MPDRLNRLHYTYSYIYVNIYIHNSVYIYISSKRKKEYLSVFRLCPFPSFLSLPLQYHVFKGIVFSYIVTFNCTFILRAGITVLLWSFNPIYVRLAYMLDVVGW